MTKRIIAAILTAVLMLTDISPILAAEKQDRQIVTEQSAIVAAETETQQYQAAEHENALLKAAAGIQTFGFSGASLTLEGKVKLNFYAQCPNAEGVYDPGVLFFRAEPTEEQKQAAFSAGKMVRGEKQSDGSYRFTYDDIAAKEMNDRIYAVPVAKLPDGTAVFGDAAGLSAAEYVNIAFDTYTDETLRTMLVDMLNYGAAAQEYFGYRTDALANAGLTAEQRALATMKTCDVTSGVKSYRDALSSSELLLNGASLTLENEVAINLYFGANSSRKIKTAELLLFDNANKEFERGDAVCAEKMNYDGDEYVGSVRKISAKNMKKNYYLRMYAEYDDGGTAYSDVIRCSVESYTYAVMNGDYSTKLKTLADRMMRYGDSACVYFGGENDSIANIQEDSINKEASEFTQKSMQAFMKVPFDLEWIDVEEAYRHELVLLDRDHKSLGTSIIFPTGKTKCKYLMCKTGTYYFRLYTYNEDNFDAAFNGNTDDIPCNEIKVDIIEGTSEMRLEAEKVDKGIMLQTKNADTKVVLYQSGNVSMDGSAYLMSEYKTLAGTSYCYTPKSNKSYYFSAVSENGTNSNAVLVAGEEVCQNPPSVENVALNADAFVQGDEITFKAGTVLGNDLRILRVESFMRNVITGDEFTPAEWHVSAQEGGETFDLTNLGAYTVHESEQPGTYRLCVLVSCKGNVSFVLETDVFINIGDKDAAYLSPDIDMDNAALDDSVYTPGQKIKVSGIRYAKADTVTLFGNNGYIGEVAIPVEYDTQMQTLPDVQMELPDYAAEGDFYLTAKVSNRTGRGAGISTKLQYSVVTEEEEEEPSVTITGVTRIDENSARVNWVTTGNTEVLRVSRADDESFKKNVVNMTVLQDDGYCDDHGIQSGKTYYYRVMAVYEEPDGLSGGVIYSDVWEYHAKTEGIEDTIPVAGVSLNTDSLSLMIGETTVLTATLTPTDATNKDLIWTTTDEKVAAVDADGKVTAVGKGTATITVTSADGSNRSASCLATVSESACGHDEITHVQVGVPVYEQMENDDEKHQVTAWFAKKCRLCGAVVEDGISETWMEEHRLNAEGACELCGCDKCLHTVMINDYVKTTYMQIYADDVQHRVTNHYRLVCESCEEIIDADHQDELLADHTFDSTDRCTLCGYKKQPDTVEIVEPVLVHPALSMDEDSLPAYTEDDMTLVWGDVAGAVKYTVRMDEYWDEDWDKLIDEDTTDESFVIDERELYEGGMFRVRITAHGADAKKEYSDWYYFQVGASSYIWVRDEIEFDYEADDYTTSICTTRNWEATVSGGSWISISPKRGFASSSFDIEVTENNGDFPRTGTIAFTNDAGGYALMTVIQEGDGSANEGKLRIDYPEQGDTVEYGRIDVEWTDKTRTAEYYAVELYDLTSKKTAYTQNMTTADYDYIPKSKVTQGHIYRLTVVAYNVKQVEIARGSIIFKIEGDDPGSSGGDSEDEVIETPEVPEGTTEVVYSGIVNNSKIEKKDLNISWQKVIGADYYAIALRDLTLYPDGMPDADVQKVIDTTTKNLSYQISESKLVYGHTYRLWIGAHKNGVSTAINGKSIVFKVENAPLRWKAVMNGESTIKVDVIEGTPDANTPYLFIAEDADGLHYPGNSTPNIAAGSAGATFKIKNLQMKRAKAYDLYVLPAGVSLTDENRTEYSAGKIVVPLWSGNMISKVYSGNTNVTSTKKLHVDEDIKVVWEASYGVYNVEVTAALNGTTVFNQKYTDPALIDRDEPITTTIDSSCFDDAEAGDKLVITVTVTPTAQAQAALAGAGLDLIASKSWRDGIFIEQLTELDLALTNNSTDLNPVLAKASVDYAALAYNTSNTVAKQLRADGFTVRDYAGYNHPNSDHYVGYSIASKIVNRDGEDYAIYAVVIRGTFDSIEWLFNFNLGTGTTHLDFNACAINIKSRLNDLISEDKYENVNVWITGHSRGAAVGNILAAKCCNDNTISNVYAYTFATPAVSTNCDSSLPIYNYVDRADLIPMLPMEEWGYERHGKTIYFGAIDAEMALIPFYVREMVNDDKILFASVYEVLYDYVKEYIRTSPEMTLEDILLYLEVEVKLSGLYDAWCAWYYANGYSPSTVVVEVEELIVAISAAIDLATSKYESIFEHHVQSNYVNTIYGMY